MRLSQSLGICLFFIVASTWCTLHNKVILKSVLPASNLLLLLQNLFAIAVLLASQALGLIRCRTISLSPRVVFGSAHAKQDALIGVLYTLNVMTGLWSLKFLTVPMFGALKRMNIIIVWLAEVTVLHTNGIYDCLPALLVMLAGTVIASIYDLHFVAAGYLLAAASSLFQGGAFVLSKKYVRQHGDQSPAQRIFGTLYFNSLVSLPLLVFVCLQSGELAHLEALRPPHWHNLLMVALNALSIFAMNFSIFLNCNLNSPLSHAMCGNMKAAATSVLGFAVFHKPVTHLGGVGLVLNFAGGMWYSYVKYLQKSNVKHHQHV
eukprot:EG_transcript_14034